MPTKLTELAVSSFGKIDGLVINHGLLAPRRFADTTVDEWKQIFDVNVFSGIAIVSCNPSDRSARTKLTAVRPKQPSTSFASPRGASYGYHQGQQQNTTRDGQATVHPRLSTILSRPTLPSRNLTLPA